MQCQRQGKVQIHALWGYCLTGFAFLRFVTYLFVWLTPPRSILPSRPPSEALASFFLSCGGLIFIMSDEEITFAAMRRGYDGIIPIYLSKCPGANDAPLYRRNDVP
jgi:hypothetical protein